MIRIQEIGLKMKNESLSYSRNVRNFDSLISDMDHIIDDLHYRKRVFYKDELQKLFEVCIINLNLREEIMFSLCIIGELYEYNITILPEILYLFFDLVFDNDSTIAHRSADLIIKFISKYPNLSLEFVDSNYCFQFLDSLSRPMNDFLFSIAIALIGSSIEVCDKLVIYGIVDKLQTNLYSSNSLPNNTILVFKLYKQIIKHMKKDYIVISIMYEDSVCFLSETIYQQNRDIYDSALESAYQALKKIGNRIRTNELNELINSMYGLLDEYTEVEISLVCKFLSSPLCINFLFESSMVMRMVENIYSTNDDIYLSSLYFICSLMRKSPEIVQEINNSMFLCFSNKLENGSTILKTKTCYTLSLMCNEVSWNFVSDHFHEYQLFVKMVEVLYTNPKPKIVYTFLNGVASIIIIMIQNGQWINTNPIVNQFLEEPFTYLFDEFAERSDNSLRNGLNFIENNIKQLRGK